MGKAEIYTAISTVVPCVHMAWREGTAPALPWAVYYLDESSSLFASNTRYANVNRWTVELYQKSSDLTLETQLETALDTNFGGYSKSEAWIDTENCVQTTYMFTEIERTN